MMRFRPLSGATLIVSAPFPGSSSASRFTAGASAFFILSQSGGPSVKKTAAVAAALPIVGRAVAVVVPGGVVTTVVGADPWIAESAFRVINPQMSATIRVAKQALRRGFVEVDARN